MRYLGNKRSLLHFIDGVLERHHAVSRRDAPLCVCDPFTGTTSVAGHLKRREWRVISGDIMAYSYALQHAYIGLNESPGFAGLVGGGALDPDLYKTVPLQWAIAHLNNLPGVEGYFYRTYSPAGGDGRRFFTAGNALRIDAIREEIKGWWERGWLEEPERYVLIAALIESVSKTANVAGTYAAYLKGWDPRAHKPLVLSVPQVVHSAQTHSVNMADANELTQGIECDLLYIDPPYNSRQYSTNYHLLETLALGDEPETRGVAGLRVDEGRRQKAEGRRQEDDGRQTMADDSAAEAKDVAGVLAGKNGNGSKKSAYCRVGKAAEALDELVRGNKARWILVSYSSEGIIPHERIVEILAQRGNVEVYDCEYRRFRSDADGDNRRYGAGDKVKEMLFWVEV